MKTIKNVLFIALLLAGTTAFAQQGMGLRHEGKCSSHQEPVNGVMQQLNLSAEQMAKLEKIKTEYSLKDSIAFADFRKQKEQVRLERMNAFKSLLNKEQQEKFENLLYMRADRQIFKHGKGMEGKVKACNRAQSQNKCDQKCNGCQEGACCQAKMKSGEMEMHGNEACPMHKDKPQAMGMMAKGSMHKMSPEQRAQTQTEKLTKVLELNKKQAAQVQEINLRYAQKDTLKSGDMQAKNEIREARQKEIKSVLNKEQKEEFEELLQMQK